MNFFRKGLSDRVSLKGVPGSKKSVVMLEAFL
jgi:hypothetical protein